MLGRRKKCPVCGLYLGRSGKAHTGTIHDRIRAARGGRIRRLFHRRKRS